MKTTRYALFSLVVILASILAACGSSEVVVTEQVEVTSVVEVEKEVTVEVEKVVTATPEPEGTVKRGGVLRVSLESDANLVDPHKWGATVDWNYMNSVYESLVAWDRESLLPKPLLAKSWEISPDELAWTFHLEEDITWHNGDPFTANDVKYSMERLLDPETGATRSTNYVGLVESVDAVDDHTVVFHLTRPFGPFLTGMPADFLIVNQKFVEERKGDITRTMMGTGPFMFKEWIPDQVIRLVRNPNYWRKGVDGQPLPYLDGVDFMPNSDRTAAVAVFESGEIDLVYSVPEKDVERLMDDPAIRLAGPDSIWYSSIRVNTEIPPFDDVRVRQAVSWAIDRDEITEVGLFGHADPAYGGSIPDWHWAGSGLVVYDHRDLEKAKALLAEAGFPNGEGFPDIEMVAPANYPTHVTEAEMIVSYLRDLGINAKTRIVEWSTLLEEAGFGSNAGENTYSVYVCGWIGTGDPHDVLGKMYPSDSEFNFMFNYSNSTVDGLLKEAADISDFEERAALYAQTEEILLEEVPDIYIDFHHVWHAMHDPVKGFVAMPNQAMSVLDEVWLDN